MFEATASMPIASPWMNPSPEQEQAWHEQRVSALAAHRQALVIDYAVTAELRDGALASFNANCR
jgi:hypothetical protein